MILGKTVPGPLRRETPSTTTFKIFLGSMGGRTIFGEAFAMTSAGATGGVTAGTTGGSRTGVLISGIAIVGAGLGSGFTIVFAPEISGAGAGAIAGLFGADGFGATGIFAGRAGTFCLMGGGKDATTSPGVSENFTKMGLDTK